MSKYLQSTCNKCDFGYSEPPRTCLEGRCSTYEPSYIKVGDDCPIGCSSLEEFDEKYGTHWSEKVDEL